MNHRTRKPTTPEAIGREQAAVDIIAASADLEKLDLFRLNWSTRVGFLRLEYLIECERLKRGTIKLTDLPPHQRRDHIDVDSLDLHALAAGPIMQPDQLFLPAGKLSMEETRAREAANMERQ